MSNANKTPEPQAAPKASSFWDSTWSVVCMVAAILAARFLIVEPFKIPSGSMEPTLVGHEDYGDRILTNKLAYKSPEWAACVIAGVAVVIVAVFIASKGWRRRRDIVLTALLLAAVAGGMGYLWAQGSIGGAAPRRFDVTVFEYEKKWDDPASTVKQNYIKRCCGLPGERILIAGGNLYRFDDARNAYRIVRLWETKPELQESLWYPVTRAWQKTAFTPLTECEAEARRLPPESVKTVRRQLDNLAFPWKGAEAGTPGVKLGQRQLELDGAAPVALQYKYPVTNVHVKTGRWPFRHIGCPAAKALPPIQAEDGPPFSNPGQLTDKISAYVSDTWDGVQCPNCLQVEFPLSMPDSHKPGMLPVEAMAGTGYELFPNFLYGGSTVVGDLKLELDIDVEAAGKVTLEAGNSLHRAVWTLPGSEQNPGSGADVHFVAKASPQLSPGRHTLSLAWVDGTVVAVLDGREHERLPVDIQPPLAAAKGMQSVVNVRFEGVKGRVTRLDLFRNLIHLPRSTKAGYRRQDSLLTYDSTEDTFEFRIPEKQYLMLGDNGPSSADSRVWGFVPEKNLVGRGSVIWWPPSRWRVIK